MKSLHITQCECDDYCITIKRDILNNLKNICIKDLIIFVIEFTLTILMEIELSQILTLKKGEHSKERTDYRNGYNVKT